MKDLQQSFSNMVASLVKPGEEILQTLSPQQAHLLHMLIGISGEVGELTDAIKKSIIYGKPLDRENVVEEIGDVFFYMEGLMQGLDISGKECIEANISKLSVRYAAGKYSNEQAVERADK
jgi:NTP pyrophosphatase (non-canonical NTP hydrolase)